MYIIRSIFSPFFILLTSFPYVYGYITSYQCSGKLMRGNEILYKLLKIQTKTIHKIEFKYIFATDFSFLYMCVY